MGEKIENEIKEKKETRQEIVTAVILQEIDKERLIYRDLLKAVRKELPEDLNLKDKEFSETLGEMSANRLIDSKVTQGYYEWFLTTKGEEVVRKLAGN